MQDAETKAQNEMKQNTDTEKDMKNITSGGTLVMVDLADGEGEAWLARWQRAGQPWKERVLTTLAEARIALGEWESSHLLIGYRSPLKQLEIALAKGTPPAQAVVNWKDSTEALLNLYRGHWQRITLVELEAVAHNESKLLKHLEQRSGLTLTVPKHELAQSGQEESNDLASSPMYELIAMQLLNMRKSKPLFQELEASSLPLLERPDIIQLVEKALNSSKSQMQLAEERLAAERRALEEEKEALEAQAGLTRQEFEAEKQTLEKKIQELETQDGLTNQQIEAEKLALASEREKLLSKASLTQQELEKEKNKLLSEKTELQQENDLIIEQLHKVQEELESYYLKNKEIEGDIKTKNQKLHDFSQRNKKLKAQLDAVKAEVKRIRNSRSWKITAPLRKKAKGPVEPK